MAIELYSKATLDTLLAGKLSDAPIDGNIYGRKDGAWEIVTGGGGVAWGAITGTVTDQTDLTSYLGSNYYPLSSNPAGYLTSAPGKSVNTLTSASYTLASGDANNIVYVPPGLAGGMGPAVITIPDDATYSFAVGTVIQLVVNNIAYGSDINFAQGNPGTPAPVLIYGASVSGSPNISSSTNGNFFLTKVAADLWVIS